MPELFRYQTNTSLTLPMKYQAYLMSRFAFVAVIAGTLSCAGLVYGQESTASRQEPATTPTGSTSTSTTATQEEGPPRGTGSMAGVGQKPRKSDAAKTNTTATGASMQVAAQDKNFMMEAAKGGMMEVQMGQMAEQQGQSDDVKKLGRQIVADHTKANNQLMGIASKKGVKLDTRHKMAKIDSSKFDQAWLAQMVTDHEKTIAAFEKEAQSGSDADVKSFATQTLPTLKKHLTALKSAQGKMAKKS